MMFQEVMQALDNNKHLLIEAGTGTGKSLGYLPSIYQSVKQEQKVMVSTHTINLQEQRVTGIFPCSPRLFLFLLKRLFSREEAIICV